MEIKSPGNSIRYGTVIKKVLPSAIMLPQLGAGGFTPSPRKSSAASERRVNPIPRVATTIAGCQGIGEDMLANYS